MFDWLCGLRVCGEGHHSGECVIEPILRVAVVKARGRREDGGREHTSGDPTSFCCASPLQGSAVSHHGSLAGTKAFTHQSLEKLCLEDIKNP